MVNDNRDEMQLIFMFSYNWAKSKVIEVNTRWRGRKITLLLKSDTGFL